MIACSSSHSLGFNLIKASPSYKLHTQYGIKICDSQQCILVLLPMRDAPALHDGPIGSVANYFGAIGNLSFPLVVISGTC